ncbi:MAG TPA: tetraacyldisaccharide 4'-kinase [Cyclobacteriaceae bacterium]|nr:tetraacyldisaccharide 4'-kinase [Cyclobacteriaceae bacterium]
MTIIRLLLFPFALLYDLATRIRNYLYDIGHKSSFQFDTPIIAVGNLNVGGSGKTPMIEYLIMLLKNNRRVATLSRGFKRSTIGYKAAGEMDTAQTIGDEPFQILRKFGREIKVIVGEDRVLAIPHILQEFPETEVILLDDAFQHRSVKAHLNILLTEYFNPFYRDFVLPAGRLRESSRGARRADIIVVTKCPERISDEEKKITTREIQKYAGNKPVFFSGIQYQPPIALGNQQELLDSIVLVSGIAKEKSILDFCKINRSVLRHFNFPDHHRYTTDDLRRIEAYCQTLTGPYSIVTTEKDMVKLIRPDLSDFLDRLPWFYIPIRQVFLQDGMKFDELVHNVVANASRG